MVNKMKLSEIDFSELEFEEIGVWPLPLRIGAIIVICVLTIVGSYFFTVNKQVQNLHIQVKKQKKLRNEFKLKYNRAVNLDAYRKQMAEITKTYKQILRQLPSTGQVALLIDDISQQARSTGLEYQLIKPGEANDLGFYMELPIDLLMNGSYHGFGEFVSGISKLPRIVTLHDFTIKKLESSNTEENLGPLEMRVEAKTYWTSAVGGDEK